MNDKSKQVTLTFRMPIDKWEKFERIAKNNFRSMNLEAKKIICDYLTDEE